MSKLFQPIKFGDLELSHRIVLAPLTRCRAGEGMVPPSFAVKYYSDRGSVPGTYLITEATIIAPYATGMDVVPGIWSDEQVARWREVCNMIYGNDSDS
jgi:NADPH2 dehydrogenase